MNLSKKVKKQPYTCQKSAVFREGVKNMKRGGTSFLGSYSPRIGVSFLGGIWSIMNFFRGVYILRPKSRGGHFTLMTEWVS